ncbi:MAG: GGDEF domain-containing protein [Lachnospiraceae bacterium]|nr:GGDEF domain-containing protein [Lachnospiraceae bacterium]MDD3796874.1 GGDEF domain-containing protein [Lachnospiraceae bacterium]
MEKTYTIGVLIGNANSPHTMDLMQEIHRSSKKLNVNILYFLGIHSRYYYRSYFGENSEDDFDYQFNIVYDYAWLGKVDALVIAYGSLGIFLENNNKNAFLKKFSGIPYVLLEESDETHQGTSIISDNYNGMYELTEHLTRDHKYRNFTYLAGPAGNTDASERKHAFLDVMKKYEIPFDETRIQYGDFSACVENQINYLLDHFPDMEAMVCANDVMASAAYSECEKRGIVVGRDLAITGYDDWEVSKSMDPPMTTVLQNAYDMGYMAIMNAIELCRGKRPHAVIIPAHVQLRSSCGCSACLPEETPVTDKNEQFLISILLSDSNDTVKDRVRANILPFLKTDFLKKENHEKILEKLKAFLDSPCTQYISPYALNKALCDYINTFPASSETHLSPLERHQILADIREKVQHAILAHIIYHDQQKFFMFQQETWFLPLISRDMMNHFENDQEFYRAAMLKLPALRAKSSYLYIFDQPILHRAYEAWSLPEKMHLAAYHEGNHIVSFQEQDRPVLSPENGMISFHTGNTPFSMSVFCLFSGEMQYGILVSEIDPSNLALSYLISMQIGNALKFHALSRQQRETQHTLEKLLQELHEKNELLNFISEYDTLTNCLNRRGLLEQATRLNKLHSGKEGVLIFADVDHLKEINDCFGHAEGDFSIQYSAKALQNAVKDHGIVGRIGGDEFVAMIVSEDSGLEDSLEDNIIRKIKDETREFNLASDKPYYIELSMGYHKFTCNAETGTILSEILEKADQALYEEKKKRRKSVWK